MAGSAYETKITCGSASFVAQSQLLESLSRLELRLAGEPIEVFLGLIKRSRSHARCFSNVRSATGRVSVFDQVFEDPERGSADAKEPLTPQVHFLCELIQRETNRAPLSDVGRLQRHS